MQAPRQLLAVVRPPGVVDGAPLVIRDTTGQHYRIAVPAGVAVGATFHVEIATGPPPAAMAPPPPMGLPVEQMRISAPPPLRRQPSQPSVQQPSQSLLGSEAETRALLECPICFDELSSEPNGCFYRGGRRTCSHFFHLQCCRDLPHKSCPMCRADFDEIKCVPSVKTEPDAWFTCVDNEGKGLISKPRLAQALLAQLPLDVHAFSARLEAEWPALDPQGRGGISRDVLRSKGGAGLLATLSKAIDRPELMPELVRAPVLDMRGPVPDIHKEPAKWFDRFDEDSNGKINQTELVRALIKTGVQVNQVNPLGGVAEAGGPALVSSMHELVDAVWDVFASGDTISKSAFLKTDGLGEAIVAALDHRAGERSPAAAGRGGGGGSGGHEAWDSGVDRIAEMLKTQLGINNNDPTPKVPLGPAPSPSPYPPKPQRKPSQPQHQPRTPTSQVIDSACDLLGVERKGSLTERAHICWHMVVGGPPPTAAPPAPPPPAPPPPPPEEPLILPDGIKARRRALLTRGSARWASKVLTAGANRRPARRVACLSRRSRVTTR